MVCALQWRTGDVAEAERGERKSIAMTLMHDVQGSALEPLGRGVPSASQIWQQPNKNNGERPY
jgi:hypothetical protein